MIKVKVGQGNCFLASHSLSLSSLLYPVVLLISETKDRKERKAAERQQEKERKAKTLVSERKQMTSNMSLAKSACSVKGAAVAAVQRL